MSRTSQLLDLVVRWEELRASGVAAEPDDLCRDCPDCVEELRECLRAMEGMDAVLNDDRPATATGQDTVNRPATQVPAVSHGEPSRDDRLVGVVTADLARGYFGELRQGIDRLDLGPRSCCFVVSAKNRILVHPIDRFEFPSPDSDLASLPLDASFRQLADQWLHNSSGTAHAVDFATGRPARFAFFRVPSAGWTVVLATF